MKHNGHLTFQCIIDYWGVYFDEKLFYGMPGAMFSFNAVHVVIIVLFKK